MRDASPASLLLQRVRDEAHHFAIAYHKKLRGKAGLSSVLDEIPGIGAERRRSLLTHLGGWEGIMKATAAELAQVPGMTSALAQRVWEQLHSRERGGKDADQDQ